MDTTLSDIARQADIVMYLTLVCSAIAAVLVGQHYYETQLALLGSAIVLAAGSAAVFAARGTRMSCVLLTICNAAIVALQIQLSQGMTEFHFGIFVLLGLLLVYRDWRPIVLAAGVFGIHHLLFDRLQALGFSVFCTAHADLPLVILHAAYVVLQTAIEIFLSLQLRRSAVEAAELSLIVGRVDRGGRVCLSIEGIPARAPTAVVLKALIAKIEAAMNEVSASTSHVEHAATEIANGNADLSRRTETQASSLQETAASMEQLTGTVRQNADNAQQATTLATTASGIAQRGREVVGRVVETMQGISGSSARMAEIISVIEGIAFQTNILALNAAVEAARAGEQGRGFAVVAGEVRTLAQRSAGAAKEIKTLIGESADRVDAGSKLVEEAGSTINEVVVAVKRVTDIMGEISSASQEQRTGIEQVNLAVRQMDQVTQQNAALVEEASAAAHSMAEQAQALRDAVAVFEVDDRGSEPGAALSVTGRR